MTIDDQMKDENIKYNINRGVAKMSASGPGKIDKYENLKDEEMLSSDQSEIEPAKRKYSPIGKTFEK